MIPIGIPREAVFCVIVSFIMVEPPYTITLAAKIRTINSITNSKTFFFVPVSLSAQNPILMWSRFPNTSAEESNAIHAKL